MSEVEAKNSSKSLQDPEGLPLTLFMARDAYEVDPNNPMGRQSAGASFLKAYLNYSGNTSHHLVVPYGDPLHH